MNLFSDDIINEEFLISIIFFVKIVNLGYWVNDELIILMA